MGHVITCPGCDAELEADLAKDAMIIECPLCFTSFNAAEHLTSEELASLPETIDYPAPETPPEEPEAPSEPQMEEAAAEPVGLADWMEEADSAGSEDADDGGATKLIDGVVDMDAEFLHVATPGDAGKVAEAPAEAVEASMEEEYEPVPEALSPDEEYDEAPEEAVEKEGLPVTEGETAGQEDYAGQVTSTLRLDDGGPEPPLHANAPLVTAQGEETFGDYILISKIGSSDIAVTYRARHVTSAQVVALKVLLGSSPWAEEETARVLENLHSLELTQLEHPNIAKVFEIGENDGIPYITTEYVEGRPLSNFRDESISPSETLSIVDDIADAIGYAHDMGVLHGDLKPKNIIIDSFGSPKVTDFGFYRSPDTAKKAGISDEFSARRVGYEFPYYAAPEQVQDGETYIESDIYSLGAILYHFLTGRPPLSSDNLTRLCLKIRDEAPRPVRLINPEVTPALQAVVLKCLAKRPTQRYHSCESLKAEIHRLMIGAPIAAETHGTMRRTLGMFARVAALAVLVAGGIFLFSKASTWSRKHFAAEAGNVPNEEDSGVHPVVESALAAAKASGPEAAETILLEHLKELEKLPPARKLKTLPGVYYFLGRMAEDRGDTATAAGYFERILAIDATHVRGLYCVGRLRYTAGDYPGAADMFARAVNSDDAGSDIYMAYGLALWGKGDIEGATAQFRKSVALDPENSDARGYLARLNEAR
ncbi:MAG: protein kinase [Planctomycetes bacterium]|nr:protein kinase [Planctomycetota bacterium]